jgi:AcrR family transcriptional regulator
MTVLHYDGVREWIPVPSSAKGRLAVQALEAFGRHGYAGIGVGELAAAAGVTTGSLYHHFGSKLGLYAVVRTEVERRVLDRMEGAAAARRGEPPAVIARAAMLVGFDYVVSHGYARLLAEPDPGGAADPIEALLVRLTGDPLGRLAAAAWRAALSAATNGVTPVRVRTALGRLLPA